MTVNSAVCPDAEALSAYVEQAVDQLERESIHHHLDGCESCRQTVSELAKILTTTQSGGRSERNASFASPTPGESLGRFVILKNLGSGGMGRVMLAYDPELARNVALKMMHAPRAMASVLSEARSLAKLSHPNVVAVYDVVQASEHAFLAMEYLEGPSLAQWLQIHPQAPWRVRLGRLQQAGAGLAAAHRLGIIHRDVKPANVICTEARTVMADFGLAHSDDGTSNAIVGTPAYMAPEVRAGRAADARSDQYSFCVMALEVLGSAKIPTRIRRALNRGRSESPLARHESMDALLSQLQGATRTRVAVGLGASLALMGIAFGAWGTVGVSWRCKAESALADRAWSTAAREATSNALRKLGADEPTQNLVLKRISTFVTEWQAISLQSCRARGAQPVSASPVFAAREQCLQGRLQDLNGLLAVMAQGTLEKTNAAINAVAALPSSRDCLVRVSPIAGATAVSSSPEVLDIYAELVRLEVLSGAGTPAKVKMSAEALEKKAEALGLGYVQRHAAMLAAKATGDLGDFKSAEPRWISIADAAMQGGEESLFAYALLELSRVTGPELNRVEAGKVWARAGQFQTLRLAPEASLSAKLERVFGYIAELEGDNAQAVKRYEAALKITEDAYGPEHPDLFKDLTMIGLVSMSLDRPKSHEALKRALDIAEKIYGTKHPRYAAALANLGNFEERSRRFSEALPYFEQAIAVLDRPGEPPHESTPSVLNSLALAEAGLGNRDAARRHHERSLQLNIQFHGEAHLLVANSISNLANLDYADGKPEQAVQGFRRSIAIVERIGGPNHPNLAPQLTNLGTILADQGRCRESLEFSERARAIRERSEPDTPRLALNLHEIGRCKRMLGQPKEAVDVLERGLAIATKSLVDAVPPIRLELAKSLLSLGGHETQASQLLKASESDALARHDDETLEQIRTLRKRKSAPESRRTKL